VFDAGRKTLIYVNGGQRLNPGRRMVAAVFFFVVQTKRLPATGNHKKYQRRRK
jgi:hypothetical protein